MTIGYSKPKLTAITFDNITWVTDVPAKGGTATKDNCKFKVYAKYNNGISVDISSDATVEGILAVEPSTADQRREVGQLTLTALYRGFTATGNVTAYQAADFSTKPLTFNILSAGTINWTVLGGSAKTIEYKLNDDNWASITSNTEGAKITVNSGGKVQFRGNNAQYCDGASFNTFYGSTARFEIEGNIMSLINSENFATLITLESDYTFSYLFRGCTGLTSAENLVLPATTLANYCYYYMFQGCRSLTTAPKLPAKTLGYLCYGGMFNGCISLTTAPELPATELKGSCYNGMFFDCASLTTAPKLPAKTLESYCYMQMFYNCVLLTVAPELPAAILEYGCYQSMFENCRSLNYIKCLATDISARYCRERWVSGVASTGTFVKNPSVKWPTGGNGIPSKWNIQNA